CCWRPAAIQHSHRQSNQLHNVSESLRNGCRSGKEPGLATHFFVAIELSVLGGALAETTGTCAQAHSEKASVTVGIGSRERLVKNIGVKIEGLRVVQLGISNLQPTD
ncbi:MAG TPA: hypothetical protein VGJ30_05310, partial [Candidatus Angelobacter sp.]